MNYLTSCNLADCRNVCGSLCCWVFPPLPSVAAGSRRRILAVKINGNENGEVGRQDARGKN